MKSINTLATTARVTAAIIFSVFVSVSWTHAQPMIPFMKVTSTAFEDGGVVPNKYSFHYDNVQPDFTITAPENAVSYAIVFHDIDVSLGGSTNDVTHWIAWNIPKGNIAEGKLPEGSVQGKNITGQVGYMGPGAPKSDRYHHYVFEFYALSENLSLDSSATRQQLLDAMNGKIVAKAAYVGRFSKPE